MSAVHRFRVLLGAEIRFQYRHGFYFAYAGVCALYLVLLYAIPVSARATVLAVLVFADTSVLGFLFVGGIELLERSQGTHRWLFVSPARIGEIVAAKVVSLVILSLSATAVLYGGALHMPDLLRVAAACSLNAVLFTLIGTAFSLTVRSINGFFLLSIPLTLPFAAIPLLVLADLLPNGWLAALVPTTGTLALLLRGDMSAPADGVALMVALLWCGAAWFLCKRSMRRYAARNAEVRS